MKTFIGVAILLLLGGCAQSNVITLDEIKVTCIMTETGEPC